MHQVELIAALLAVVAIVGAASQKLRVALPILLVLAGMAISLVPGLPHVRLEPDTVFFIFLPPLLYTDSFNTQWRELKDVGEVITLQAVGLVLITVVAVAAAIHAVVPGMGWSVAFAFGAIVSPTDAVAASAISKEVHLPKKLMDVIKGESLINDATGLVAYQFAIAATLTGAFSWSHMGRQFLYVGLGGIAVGLGLGWVLAKIRTRLNEKPVEVIVSLLSPFLAYLTAEHLHVSGVLAVVSAGLLLGWRGPLMLSPQARLQSTATWDTIVYVLNGFSFLLMGLQLRPILDTVRKYPQDQLVLWTLTAAITPIIIRFVWSFTTTPLYQFIRRRPKPDWKELFIFSWSGMRGVVSLAAALAIPLSTHDGAPFPFRDLLIFLTIIVIASTLILQGMTLPPLIRKLGFSWSLYDQTEAERRARFLLAREAVVRIDEILREKHIDIDDPTVQSLLNRYLEQSISNAHPSSPEPKEKQTGHMLQREIIKAQRQKLIAMRDTDQIEADVFFALQKELDLDQARLD